MPSSSEQAERSTLFGFEPSWSTLKRPSISAQEAIELGIREPTAQHTKEPPTEIGRPSSKIETSNKIKQTRRASMPNKHFQTTRPNNTLTTRFEPSQSHHLKNNISKNHVETNTYSLPHLPEIRGAHPPDETTRRPHMPNTQCRNGASTNWPSPTPFFTATPFFTSDALLHERRHPSQATPSFTSKRHPSRSSLSNSTKAMTTFGYLFTNRRFQLFTQKLKNHVIEPNPIPPNNMPHNNKTIVLLPRSQNRSFTSL